MSNILNFSKKELGLLVLAVSLIVSILFFGESDD